MPPRRVTPAEFQRLVRQAQQKQRQAISNYNSAVRKYNADVKRAVDQYNTKARAANRAIDDYNRAARNHNARVRSNQRRLNSEMARLRAQPVVEQYTAVRSSTVSLHEAYTRVDAEATSGLISERSAGLVDLAEAEAANSARVANALFGSAAAEEELETTELNDELSSLSEDLDRRWRGALFALSPRNPDAARHFCTSSREVLVQMIDLKAPDADVLRANPQCQTTDDGRVLRREKIGYLLASYGEDRASLGDFIDADVNDVMKLFRTFNEGTHGDAGAFDLSTLRAVKSRVEGAIRFLSRIIRGI